MKTDDRARCHPKFFRAGFAAFGWWSAGLGYCNEHLTDGFIATRDLELVFPGALPADRAQAIESLVREGLIHVVSKGRRPACPGPLCRRYTAREDGYLMHDYLVYQPSKRFTKRVRQVRLDSARKGGQKSAEVRGKAREVFNQNGSTTRQPVRQTPEPVPSRPVPDPKDRSSKAVVLTDDQFIHELSANPAYQHLDVRSELARMDAWLLANPSRKKTRRFVVGWLNRIERPMAGANGVPAGALGAKLEASLPAMRRFVDRGEG